MSDHDLLDMEGQVAIVTGAGQGAGRAIARELARHNCGGVAVNDFVAARAEAVKTSMFPGTAVMYWLGTRGIHDLRTRLRAVEGPAFSLKAFHDRFLSYGALPVQLIAHLMASPTDEPRRHGGTETTGSSNTMSQRGSPQTLEHAEVARPPR